MNQFQHTIKNNVQINGKGLHSGQKVRVNICPAPPNHGYKFKRVDLDNQPIIKADVEYVSNTQRSTTLSYQGVNVSTVEHLLAALTGLQIDNVLIEVDAEEMPIMDGSAKNFVEILQTTTRVKQKAIKEYFELTENIDFYDEEKDCRIIALPATNYKLTTMIDFNSKVVGQQYATLQKLTDFVTEISEARTFCFLHELELLLANGLIKGGDLDNALVVVDEKISDEKAAQLAKVFNKKEIQIDKTGYLNNTTLRYPNELARHKLLDVMGDLALVGTPFKANIFASKSGHSSNIAFAKHLKNIIKKNRHRIGLPSYDPSLPPVYDLLKIAATLPHRYPFLLIDKIIKLNETEVVGIKNVTYNEHFFQGHFPSEPIMPGVLIIEAMAQTGGILLLNTVPDPDNYLTFFLKIQEAKFRNKVIPGDTLIFKLHLMSPIRRGLCEMKAIAYTAEKVAAEAILTAQIRKK